MVLSWFIGAKSYMVGDSPLKHPSSLWCYHGGRCSVNWHLHEGSVYLVVVWMLLWKWEWVSHTAPTLQWTFRHLAAAQSASMEATGSSEAGHRYGTGEDWVKIAGGAWSTSFFCANLTMYFWNQFIHMKAIAGREGLNCSTHSETIRCQGWAWLFERGPWSETQW